MSKFPGKTFLRDFNKQFSKINLLLWKKLYCIQPLGRTAKPDKFYVIYLVLTKEIAQKWQPQKFEILALIGWLEAGNNLKASII